MHVENLDAAGEHGSVPCTLWTDSGERPELGILLPGAWFGCESPPIYYATLVLLARGADVFWVDYAYHHDREYGALGEAGRRRRLRHDVDAGVTAALARAERRSLVVVGKSLGTMGMAGLIADGRLPAGTPTVWLTPVLTDAGVREALEGGSEPRLVVIGDADPYHDAALLRRLAGRGADVLVLPGAEHSLSVGVDAAATFRAMERYTTAMSAFLAAHPRGGTVAGP